MPQTRNPSPSEDSDELLGTTSTEISTPSSNFTLSPAVWTPQEVGAITPPIPQTPATITSSQKPRPNFNDEEMADTINTFFTGKPEDQDPQDFMNRIERTILMKSGLSEAEKVGFFELSLETNSPAEAWLLTLTPADKSSFIALRAVFELQWPVKPITEKTTAEKQALLDKTTLKMSNLGKRVATNLGAEEEMSHVVWADRVERLAANIPDTNNLLVTSTCKKLPKPLLKLVGLKPMTWKQFTDAVRAI